MWHDVLIAHGYPMFRDALRELLSGRSDLRVVGEASDAHSAVDLSRRLHPSIVILEDKLSGSSSIDLIRRVAAAVEGVRVIILAASGGETDALHTIDAGARAYLAGEADAGNLMKAIDTVIAGNVHVDTLRESGKVESTPKPRQLGSAGVLTERQREVLRLLAEGKSTREIARVLDISGKTVEAHRKHIMDKLSIYTVAELTKYAIRHGMTDI